MAGSSEKWQLIWPFFFILFLHSVAIFFFTRGFLLTRTELSSFSHCSDLFQSPCSHFSTDPIHFSPENRSKIDLNSSRNEVGRCWTKPAVDRVIIIILDALRFDFVAPSTFFEEAKPWMDKLQVLQKLASDDGLSARIFKAIADPPTTSMQRLKGLTTGGLPTFIDVGNSFGAPAITEDNLIYQLVRNGKRVVMMGDDTWLPLFPHHFHKSYPFPSFNVKDLHTVDNGVIDHLLPHLYSEDWDVVIAHFLGVDHAGHIFGVNSAPMIEKLEQYNEVLEEVVKILKNQSGPGGLHENTFLLVMGDHGQTINGDHGGGTAEEVETSLFAMSLRNPPASVSSVLDTSSCKSNVDGEKICISYFEQIDFAVTIAALLGVPFPFGSIGRVNPELYALSAGTWDEQSIASTNNYRYCSNLEVWMQNYIDVSCINSWQVKRYIDLYSASSALGFPSEDLLQIAELFAQAQANWSDGVKNEHLFKSEMHDGSCEGILSLLQGQIDADAHFLEHVAELARSKWTEFDTTMMGIGLCILLMSLLVQIFAIKRASKFHHIIEGNNCYLMEKICPNKHQICFMLSVTVSVLVALVLACQFLGIISLPNAIFAMKEETTIYFLGALVLLSAVCFLSFVSCKGNSLDDRRYMCQGDSKDICQNNLLRQDYNSEGKVIYLVNGDSGISLRCIAALFLVTIRACSFLSNSFILAEREVANFLLATTGILNLKYSIMKESLIIEAVAFLLLNFLLGISSEVGLSKQSGFVDSIGISPIRLLGIDVVNSVSLLLTDIGPLLGLTFLALFIHRTTLGNSSWRIRKYLFMTGIILSYMLIAVYWVLESNMMSVPPGIKDVGRSIFPRMVYALGFGLLVLLSFPRIIGWNERTTDHTKIIYTATLAMLSTWSSTILILLGRQGPFIALVSLGAGWCIIRLQKVAQKRVIGDGTVQVSSPDSISIIQWSLLAVCLFFCTGHRCTFDGLRYGAAFIGFDDFNIIRQGILLAIDTFGISHILPVLGLPLLVTVHYPYLKKAFLLPNLTRVFFIYGLITAFTTTFTILCVTIHRRHLMVWGLFAPKFVFDVLGLILTDVLICLSSLYYF